MPFTTSHPAVILLLKNAFPRYLSLTGLIAGAMSPDLLYFLELNTVNRGVSHSWNGLFMICLPLGILFSFAFHYLFKKELIENLPNPLLRHFSGLAYSEWKINTLYSWIVLIVSVLLGAVSHFGWDSCTHLAGEVVQFFPVLQQDFEMFGDQTPLYHILQHVSSIVGAIFIAIYFSYRGNLPKRVEKVIKNPKIHKMMFWIIVPLLSALFAYLVLHFYLYYAPERISSNRTVFGLASWAGFFYLTIGLGLFKRFKKV